MKSLVVYFSCSGITRGVAEKLSNIVKGDLYEIQPEIPYTKEDLDWMNKNSRSTLEMKEHSSRPAIKGKIENIKDYDIIYLGFPIWWYIAPTIINTFLESYDFSGKIIVPFATSGSSGVGKTDENLHISCSDETIWKPAKRFPSNVSNLELEKWLNDLNLL